MKFLKNIKRPLCTPGHFFLDSVTKVGQNTPILTLMVNYWGQITFFPIPIDAWSPKIPIIPLALVEVQNALNL